MDSEKTDENKVQRLSLFIFECIMAIFYVALGIVLLFTPFFNHSIQQGFRITIGIICGLYGLFRIYRAYIKISQRNE